MHGPPSLLVGGPIAAKPGHAGIEADPQLPDDVHIAVAHREDFPERAAALCSPLERLPALLDGELEPPHGLAVAVGKVDHDPAVDGRLYRGNEDFACRQVDGRVAL